MKHKTIVDELAAVGHHVARFDQVTHILDGLLEEYDPVVINVAAANQNDGISIAYVHGLLLNMEMRLARHCSPPHSPSDQTITVLFTPKSGHHNNHGGGHQGRGRGHGQNGGRGPPPSINREWI